VVCITIIQSWDGVQDPLFFFARIWRAAREAGTAHLRRADRWCRLAAATNRLPKHVTIVFFFVVVVLGGPGGPEKRDGGSGH